MGTAKADLVVTNYEKVNTVRVLLGNWRRPPPSHCRRTRIGLGGYQFHRGVGRERDGQTRTFIVANRACHRQRGRCVWATGTAHLSGAVTFRKRGRYPLSKWSSADVPGRKADSSLAQTTIKMHTWVCLLGNGTAPYRPLTFFQRPADGGCRGVGREPVTANRPAYGNLPSGAVGGA